MFERGTISANLRELGDFYVLCRTASQHAKVFVFCVFNDFNVRFISRKTRDYNPTRGTMGSEQDINWKGIGRMAIMAGNNIRYKKRQLGNIAFPISCFSNDARASLEDI